MKTSLVTGGCGFIDSPDQCFEVNAVDTQRVLEWSRLNGIKNFVYSSTSSRYDHQNQIPFNPNMSTDLQVLIWKI